MSQCILSLFQIEDAFAAGYDPALELAKQHTKRPLIDDFEGESHEIYEAGPWTKDLRRKEQDFVDAVVHGKEPGHYFMLLGPKVCSNPHSNSARLTRQQGSGKGSMIFDSMAGCQAEGVSMCDAHPDLEVFRLRLGKALNYEFNEDSQTGLFQRRDPREGLLRNIMNSFAADLLCDQGVPASILKEVAVKFSDRQTSPTDQVI